VYGSRLQFHDDFCFDYLGCQDDLKKEQVEEAQGKRQERGQDKNVSAKELLARRKAARQEGRGGGGGGD
jgi:hypothetical protein